MNMTAAHDRTRLLVNLPEGFFRTPALERHFARLGSLAEMRTSSHDHARQMAPDLSWAHAVIMWSWPVLLEEDLARAPDLRFLGQINSSRDGAQAAMRRGIALSEARHCWSPAVAELALGLVLSGLRRTSAHHMAMRAGGEKWVESFPVDIDPLERQLTGRAVGIVGFGRIGQRLAELLRPFHVTLRVYDPFLPADVPSRMGALRVGMDELAGESEVVVLCAANSENARHVVDGRLVGMLRPDCVLVNVGRSMLVDMEALRKRLEKGELIAMLDVFDTEPLERDSPLRTLPNAFLSPHRAGGIMESVDRALTMLTDDFEAHLLGRPLRYPVTEATLPSLAD
jgi:D-3-phosphoglycerate dehydrogenase / 2-oxoglutarate reductase